MAPPIHSDSPAANPLSPRSSTKSKSARKRFNPPISISQAKPARGQSPFVDWSCSEIFTQRQSQSPSQEIEKSPRLTRNMPGVHNQLDAVMLSSSSPSSQDGTLKSKKTKKKRKRANKGINLSWTTEMDEYLFDLLEEQMNRGQKNGGTFSASAQRIVAHRIGLKFSNGCNSEHITNRLKTLKKNYAAAKELITGPYASGFGYNHSTHMIEAEESVWEPYIRAHPSARKMKFKPVLHYGRMDKLFGEDRATGEYAMGPTESCRSEYGQSTLGASASSSDFVPTSSTSNTIKQPFEGTLSTSNTKLPFKKKKTTSELIVEELESISKGMDRVADAINPRNYTEKELFAEISKIKDMGSKAKMRVYQVLTDDVNSARAFLGCSDSEDMQNLWLKMKFGDDIFGS